MEVIYVLFGDGSPTTGVLDKPASPELLAVLPAFFFGAGSCFFLWHCRQLGSNPWLVLGQMTTPTNTNFTSALDEQEWRRWIMIQRFTFNLF